MTSKESIHLFTITEDQSDQPPFCYSERRVYLDTKTGTPYCEFWRFSDITFHHGSATQGSRHDITYETMLLWAKAHSQETYDCFAEINEANWVDYVIDLI